MWQAAAIGAGLGALNYAQQKKQAEKDRQTQAQIAAYSPWTGMQAHAVSDPSLMNNVMQGGTAGLGMGQAFDASGQQEAMNAKQGQLIDAQTNYYNNAAPGAAGGSAGSMGPKPTMY